MIDQPDLRTTDHARSRETVNPGVADSTVRSATTDGLYAERRHEDYVDAAGNRSENRAAMDQDTNLDQVKRRSWVVNSVSFLLGMLEMFLLLRFFFRLLGATQDPRFILFPYQISRVFVAPFHGIFQDQALGTRSVFELSTLIAMLVFALLAWGLVALSRVVFTLNNSGRQADHDHTEQIA